MDIHILRVFVNEDGKFGNPVGVVLDEKKALTSEKRQNISTTLGFSESVFINSLKPCTISIFNPKKQIDFAGHALVGTACYINQTLGKAISSIECRGGKVLIWQEKGLTWIHANLEGTPPWRHEQLPNVSSVENLSASQIVSKEHTVVWAWIDQGKGMVRARTFATDWGIPEDEANGSGSMQLASMLGQSLEIHHGKGSVVYAKPSGKGFADVGGRVILTGKK